MSDDNVTDLPVKFKSPPSDDEPMLKVVSGRTSSSGCDHRWVYADGKMLSVQYLIGEGDAEVECSACGTRLNPMFVLTILAREDTKFDRARQRYQEEMQRLRSRSRTTCQHCRKMTRISHR